MITTTKIEWTERTWNPVRGCIQISPGCARCYAKTFAERFRGVAGHPYELGFDVRLVPDKVAEPLTIGKPQMIFVNSMSDLFLDAIPDAFIELVAEVMAAANWHTYQVLTKRSERMRDLLQTTLRPFAELPHIWWGVSVENRRHGLPRVQHLQEAVPSMTFLSVEPLLEELGTINLDRIKWVIVGGESGPGARPMDPSWAKGIRSQCEQQQIPFFFKQWGGASKKRAGRILDGRTHDDVPHIAPRPVATREHRAAWAAEFTQRARDMHLISTT